MNDGFVRDQNRLYYCEKIFTNEIKDIAGSVEESIWWW